METKRIVFYPKIRRKKPGTADFSLKTMILRNGHGLRLIAGVTVKQYNQLEFFSITSRVNNNMRGWF